MARPRLPLGSIAGLDSALAGGLALGRVHMLCANWAGAHGALTGFAICLLRQLLASNGLAPNAQNQIRPYTQAVRWQDLGVRICLVPGVA